MALKSSKSRGNLYPLLLDKIKGDKMAKTHKTVIGEIKAICEGFDYTFENNGTITLKLIQSIVTKHLESE